jgi:ATP-dependent helicase/nuclease subunit B
MERILNLEEPLDYTLEPDPLDYGSIVHDVLERFYRSLQDEPGDPVDLREWPRNELEQRMLDAGEDALIEANLPYEGSFYDRWLEALFGGLGTPETNPHYGPRGDASDAVHTSADGLFAKFIDEERARDRFPAPGWFEVGMDLSVDEGEPLLVETPQGTVPVGGRIDRVSVDWSQDPPEGLVHDYKSSSRSLRRAADGVSFQLPLYALAVSTELAEEGVETPLDASFYTLDHDDLGDGWTLSYYLYREGDGTDEDYQRLIEDVTPRRVGELAAGLENGAFQPTVLDEDTAGCRHCDFSDVCDVRYHARRDVIAAMDADSDPGYVPMDARTDSFLYTCGGDDE